MAQEFTAEESYYNCTYKGRVGILLESCEFSSDHLPPVYKGGKQKLAGPYGEIRRCSKGNYDGLSTTKHSVVILKSSQSRPNGSNTFCRTSSGPVHMPAPATFLSIELKAQRDQVSRRHSSNLGPCNTTSLSQVPNLSIAPRGIG